MEDTLLHRQLSYKVRGILFAVQNELGRYCNEKQYGDCFAEKLRQEGIVYEREKVLPVSFIGEKQGRNRIDFLVDTILIVELKSVPALSREDYFQCQRYLKALDLDLCFLVNFRPKYVLVRRVLNPDKIANNLHP